MTLDALNLMPILPEMILLGLACSILLIDAFMRSGARDVTYWLTQASLVVTFVAVLSGMSMDQRLSFDGSVINDGLSDVMKLAMILMTSMAVSYTHLTLPTKRIV